MPTNDEQDDVWKWIPLTEIILPYWLHSYIDNRSFLKNCYYLNLEITVSIELHLAAYLKPFKHLYSLKCYRSCLGQYPYENSSQIKFLTN